MNFRDFLSEYNIPTGPSGHYHVRENWIQIDCPFCSPNSQGWYLGYSIEGRFFNCWRCGSHRPVDTIMALANLSYHEAKKIVNNLEIEHSEHYEKKEKTLGTLVLPSGIKHLHSAHKKYLYNRGFDWKKIEKLWKIWGIGIAPKLQWRIWIPIHYHGEIVSWTTRSISNNSYKSRYISAKEDEEILPHKDLLYGEDFARHAIIVNEGPLNAWRIGPGAVATLGVNYSQAQILRMAKYPVRAICFDAEEDAQKRAKKLCDDLSVFPGETMNVVLDAKDAAEETEKNIKRLRKEILE